MQLSKLDIQCGQEGVQKVSFKLQKRMNDTSIFKWYFSNSPCPRSAQYLLLIIAINYKKKFLLYIHKLLSLADPNCSRLVTKRKCFFEHSSIREDTWITDEFLENKTYKGGRKTCSCIIFRTFCGLFWRRTLKSIYFYMHI